MEIQCDNKCGNLTVEGSKFCEPCKEMEESSERIKLTEENIKITRGEDDPVFNGIYIESGCKCDGYGCLNEEDNQSKLCITKKLKVKQQLLSDQEKAKNYDGELLLSKKRQSECIKMMLEIKRLKDELDKRTEEVIKLTSENLKLSK